MALALEDLVVDDLNNSNLPLARPQDDQAILGKTFDIFGLLILDLSELEL